MSLDESPTVGQETRVGKGRMDRCIGIHFDASASRAEFVLATTAARSHITAANPRTYVSRGTPESVMAGCRVNMPAVRVACMSMASSRLCVWSKTQTISTLNGGIQENSCAAKIVSGTMPDGVPGQ